MSQGLHVIYVDRGTQLPEFVWRDGQVAPPESFQARQSVHRLFTDIVDNARRDKPFDGGRYVRSGRWLLVETPLSGRDNVGRQVVATVVVQLRSGADRLAGAAGQAMEVFTEQQLPLPVNPLPEVLDQAEWQSRNVFDRFIGWLLHRAPGRRPRPPADYGGTLRERNAMGSTPELNQRLVVLTRDDYNQARATNPELLADPLTTVVPVPLRPPWTDLAQLSVLVHDLRPGAIFVRNRFNQNQYVEIGAAFETIALSKFNEFARICQLLGARSLEVQELREISDAGEQTGVINLKAGPVDASVSGGSSQFKRMAQNFRAGWTWETGEPDQQQAELLAAQSGLRSDPMINGLLQQRGHLVNRLTSHDLLLDVSAEAQNEISLVLQLETLLAGVGVKFDAKFEQLKGQSRTLQLKVRVQFGSDG